MKQFKFLRYGMIALAALLAASSVVAFIKGHVVSGICNLLWMLCEFLFYLIIKKTEIVQYNNEIFGEWFYKIKKITTMGQPAVIVKDEDDTWYLFSGNIVGNDTQDAPSCSAENNDQINYHHIVEEVGGIHE